jgi:hypothetical protein
MSMDQNKGTVVPQRAGTRGAPKTEASMAMTTRILMGVLTETSMEFGENGLMDITPLDMIWIILGPLTLMVWFPSRPHDHHYLRMVIA